MVKYKSSSDDAILFPEQKRDVEACDHELEASITDR